MNTAGDNEIKMLTRATRLSLRVYVHIPKYVKFKNNPSRLKCIICLNPKCNLQCYETEYGEKFLIEFMRYISKYVESKKRELSLRIPTDKQYKLMLNTLFPKPRAGREMNTMLEKFKAKINNAENEEALLRKLTKCEFKLYTKLNGAENYTLPKKAAFWENLFVIEIPTEESEKKEFVPIYKQINLCPYTIDYIPALSDVTKTLPTYITFANLCHLLAVYVLLVRYYRGRHIDPFACEATSQLIHISGTFANNLYYITKEDAINEAFRRSYNYLPDECYQKLSVKSIKSDIEKIFIGPCAEDPSYYVLGALGEIYHMLRLGGQTNKERKMRAIRLIWTVPGYNAKFVEPTTPEDITKCAKKVFYYYSYVKSYYSIEWRDNAGVVRVNAEQDRKRTMW